MDERFLTEDKAREKISLYNDKSEKDHNDLFYVGEALEDSKNYTNEASINIENFLAYENIFENFTSKNLGLFESYDELADNKFIEDNLSNIFHNDDNMSNFQSELSYLLKNINEYKLSKDMDPETENKIKEKILCKFELKNSVRPQVCFKDDSNIKDPNIFLSKKTNLKDIKGVKFVVNKDKDKDKDKDKLDNKKICTNKPYSKIIFNNEIKIQPLEQDVKCIKNDNLNNQIRSTEDWIEQVHSSSTFKGTENPNANKCGLTNILDTNFNENTGKNTKKVKRLSTDTLCINNTTASTTSTNTGNNYLNKIRLNDKNSINLDLNKRDTRSFVSFPTNKSEYSSHTFATKKTKITNRTKVTNLTLDSRIALKTTFRKKFGKLTGFLLNSFKIELEKNKSSISKDSFSNDCALILSSLKSLGITKEVMYDRHSPNVIISFFKQDFIEFIVSVIADYFYRESKKKTLESNAYEELLYSLLKNKNKFQLGNKSCLDKLKELDVSSNSQQEFEVLEGAKNNLKRKQIIDFDVEKFYNEVSKIQKELVYSLNPNMLKAESTDWLNLIKNAVIANENIEKNKFNVDDFFEQGNKGSLDVFNKNLLTQQQHSSIPNLGNSEKDCRFLSKYSSDCDGNLFS